MSRDVVVEKESEALRLLLLMFINKAARGTERGPLARLVLRHVKVAPSAFGMKNLYMGDLDSSLAMLRLSETLETFDGQK